MPFKKVNPKEEIDKAIKLNPELESEIKKADKEYEDKKKKMTIMCPNCRKDANYIKDDESEKLGFYAFNCECGNEFMAPKNNPTIKIIK